MENVIINNLIPILLKESLPKLKLAYKKIFQKNSLLGSITRGKIYVVIPTLFSPGPENLPFWDPTENDKLYTVFKDNDATPNIIGGFDDFPALIKPIEPINPDQITKCKIVKSGFFVTGMHDTFAVAKIVAALMKEKREIEVKMDQLSDEEKQKNLILIGGPASNLLSEKIIDHCIIHKQFKFHHDQNHKYKKIELNDETYENGNQGIIISHHNPFNSASRILLMGGLGSIGTEATCDFIVSKFDKHTPSCIKEKPNWLILIEGKVKNGYLVDSKYKDCIVL